MTEPMRIAIAGLGTVGAGTVQVLQTHADLLARRCGRPLQVTAVSARDRSRDRGVDLSGIAWYDDPAAMAREAEADMVVELIGGSDGPAKAVCEAALGAGRHVVTANKALVAVHGAELARQAEAAGRALAYEAAVAGGIPVIKAVREGLAANRVERLFGILNGTCNYILSCMRGDGVNRRDFDSVLAEAQKLGYAEADPSTDVDGHDAAHKLAILASLAFGCAVNFDAVHVEGIRHVSAEDIAFADELGYRIRLLGVARMTPHGLEQRVHPCMIPLSAPLAPVDGVTNAVVVEGDFVGTVTLEGPGAGAGPTASAVVADIVDIASGRMPAVFGVPVAQLAQAAPAPMERHRGAYYIRLMVTDRPGVIAEVSAILRDENVSMESMLQRRRNPDGPVPVVLTTHEAEEAAVKRALARIARLDVVAEAPCMIRMERF